MAGQTSEFGPQVSGSQHTLYRVRWKAGSGFHSALGQLATSEFIYEKSLLSS